MDDLILALDFGGTKLTAAMVARADVLSGGREWLACQRIFSPADADAQFDIRTMVALGRQILEGKMPLGIGVSFGGPADFTTGVVRRSDHVPGWENIPLQQLLEGEFGAPVSLDNDANAAALGEQQFGAGKGYQDLLYITVSTGVGGGWILNGRPWRGREGMAGEIGHSVIDPSGPSCLCGKRGCVERYASGPYMAQDARQWLEQAPERGRILRALGREGPVSAEMVAEAAQQGDELAAEIVKRGAWAVGVGIGNTVNVMNPSLFVLGGGVTKAGELWWQTVRRVARQTALNDMDFDIVHAALGDDAPLWGAVALTLIAL
jgi:glucokinase